MKKVVIDFVKSIGWTARYSGKQKTMFISGPFIEQSIIEQLSYGLPFKISTN